MKTSFGKILFLACLGLIVWAGTLEKEVKFSNRKIQYLSEVLPFEIPKKDTMMVFPSVISNKDIVFRYNDRHELTHLGLSLFSRETKDMLDTKICDFLERFFLELLLQKNNEEICFKLNEYYIHLRLDGQDYIKGNLMGLSDYLEMMEMPVNFSIELQNGRGNAVWMFGTHTLQLDFPLFRELIEGTDKRESDAELYNSIQGAAFTIVKREHEKVNKDFLIRKTKDIYVLPGVKIKIKELSSDQYYLKEGNDFVPVFHQDYPEYSLNNLFLNKANGENVTLQLTHRQYGHFTPEISIPLLNFLEYFRKEFELACHTGYNKKGELETIVVINHKTLNYIHLLRVHVNKQNLFKPHLLLKGDFYSNIPQHYIKTLIK